MHVSSIIYHVQHLIASMGKTKTNSHLSLPSRVNETTAQTNSSRRRLLIQNANAVRPSVPFHQFFNFVRALTCCAFIISPKPERLEILDLHYRNNQACSHSVHYRNNQACSAVRIQKCNHTSNLCSAAMRVSIFNCTSLKTSKPCCLLRQVFVGSVVMLVSHLLFWLPSFIWVSQVKSKF